MPCSTGCGLLAGATMLAGALHALHSIGASLMPCAARRPLVPAAHGIPARRPRYALGADTPGGSAQDIPLGLDTTAAGHELEFFGPYHPRVSCWACEGRLKVVLDPRWLINGPSYRLRNRLAAIDGKADVA
ncbi:hypothetical protein ACFVTC_18540 [Streptomyces sp. NPDC057950]|uniref:hypothetical protein n=1 Tax=Streptomyces sp. NPDC057950 TaxID=3346288 RepID=UPI0036EABD6B